MNPTVLTVPGDAQQWSDRHRRAGRTVGLVPTMGALHDGHMALVTEARRRADVVAVSIFVNPLQFNRRDDFDAYPRPLDADIAMCATYHADAVYAPTAATMYPPGFQTHVEPGELAEPLEGAGRPGHFRGVVTVVTKLFNAVRPDLAVFGQKDFQQLAVIRRMARDLDMGIELVALPTVREADGLAMSSRNRRLSPRQRAEAPVVYAALQAMRDAVAGGERDAAALHQIASAALAAAPDARVEYVRIVDPDSLHDLGEIDGPAHAVAAVWFGDVRLIDNLALS